MNMMARRRAMMANQKEDKMKEMKYIGEVDLASEAMSGTNKETTFALDNATEIYLEWTGMVNGTGSPSSLIVIINGVEVAAQPVPTNKSGSIYNGWTQYIYNGVAWIMLRTSGAIATNNKTPAAAQIPYNLTPGDPATSIKIRQPQTQYYATGGLVKIWAR